MFQEPSCDIKGALKKNEPYFLFFFRQQSDSEDEEEEEDNKDNNHHHTRGYIIKSVCFEVIYQAGQIKI